MVYKILLSIIIFFTSTLLAYAESVDAGIDQIVNEGDIVVLNGTASGFLDCPFVNYLWSQPTFDLTITDDFNLTGAFISSGQTTGAAGVYTINFSANASGCGPLMIDMRSASSSLQLTINSGTGSTGTGSANGGGKSRSSIMKEQAKKIFKFPDKINILLKKNNNRDKYYYPLKWNYIGGGGQINYEIESSKTASFQKVQNFETKSTYKSIVKYDLPEADIYFFRVRAEYKGEYSPWSNIVSMSNKDGFLDDFIVNCENCTTPGPFMDILDSPDLLIEDGLELMCENCDKKINYHDVWKSLELLLYSVYIDHEGYPLNKQVEYEDIWNSLELIFHNFYIRTNGEYSLEEVNYEDVFLDSRNE